MQCQVLYGNYRENYALHQLIVMEFTNYQEWYAVIRQMSCPQDCQRKLSINEMSQIKLAAIIISVLRIELRRNPDKRT